MKWKNSPEKKRKICTGRERIGELEDKAGDIVLPEEHKGQRMRKNEQSPPGVGWHQQINSIWIPRDPKEERKEQRDYLK